MVGKNRVAEFGERGMLMTRGSKKERKWSFGVWLEQVKRLQEVYLGTKEGTVRAWTVHHVQSQERWDQGPNIYSGGRPATRASTSCKGA